MTTVVRTMRAWRVHEPGDPAAVLRLETSVAVPTPVGAEVAIEVHATALNFADALLCRDTYQEHPPRPFTPGLEVAGVVTAAGPDATHAIGDRVAGSPLLPHGGFADVAIARSTEVFALTPDVAATTAAAMHVTYQTGWFALHRRARLLEGETLLVHAGAGGVGSAAVELGLAAGATVIATAGGPAKVARCRELGAHHTIDYRAGDVAATVNDLTEGRGADVIFDPVGGDTFTASTRCVAWEGRILVIGAASGRYAEARTNHALVKNYSVLGLNWRSYLARRPDLVAAANDELLELLAAGAVRPAISETLRLEDDLPAALDRLTAGTTTGKLVVVPT